MRENVRLAGVAVLLLFALSSCATTPASTGTASGEGAAPCHGAYVADMDVSVPGEERPEAAAVAWSKSVVAPSGAPTRGWTAVDELTVRSGDWIGGATPTVPGGWVVSGLGCGAPQTADPERALQDVKTGATEAHFAYPAEPATQPVKVYGTDKGVFENGKYDAVAK